MRYSVRMMGKLSTAPISSLDSKEVIVTDTNTLEPPEIEVNTCYKGTKCIKVYNSMRAAL